MSNPGVDNALNRLFANASREAIDRSLEKPPELLAERSAGLPGGGELPPPEPPPQEPPSESQYPSTYTGSQPEGEPKQYITRGLFSIPQSPQEWIDSLEWWGKQALGKTMEAIYNLPGMPVVFQGAEQFQEKIAEPLTSLFFIHPNQVEMPEPTFEQEALLKKLEDRGFPRYMSIENLEWYSLNGTAGQKELITPEVVNALRDYKKATTETAFWNQRLKQYKQLPLSVRMPAEIAATWPMFPGGGGVARGFKLLKPENLRVAASQIGRVAPKLVTEMPDLMPVQGLLEAAVRPDNAKKLAGVPGMSKVASKFTGEGALAKIAKGASDVDLGHAAKLAQNLLNEEIKAKAVSIISNLTAKGDSSNVFNLVKNVKSPQFGTIKSGPLKGVHLNTIRMNPDKYLADLTDKQVAWIQEANRVKNLIPDYLESNGIKFAKQDSETWISKGVMARVDPVTNEVEWARIGPTVKGIGGKASFEKRATFKTAEEGLAQGFRYLPEEQRLFYNLQDAYKKVANEDLVAWIQGRISWRKTDVFTLPKLNNAINTALKKEPITKQLLQTLKRDMPELATKFEDALAIPDWNTRFAALTDLRATVQKLVPSETDKLFWATEKLNQNVKLAEGAIKALQRVKRGERLPTGTIKAISKIMPEVKGKLTEVSQYTLDDLTKAGAEATEWPKTLKRGTAFPALKKSQEGLAAAQLELAKNPSNSAMFREVQKLKRKVAFSKYRLAQEGDLEISKSPVSILKGKHYDAINELLDTVRGKPSQGLTATGKAKIEYKGGLIHKFKEDAGKAAQLRKEVSDNAKKVHWGEAVIDQPAFKGMILTGKDAQKVAELFKQSTPSGFYKILKGVNAANAIPRYFSFNADASPFGIQLAFLPFSDAKGFSLAVKGFAKSFFDPSYQANLLTKKADVIFAHPNLQILASTGSEFTQRWMTKTPVFKNFIRAYETAIDAAGIHLAEMSDVLVNTGKTGGRWGRVERAWGLQRGWEAESQLYRSMQVDAFINEFRGVMSTSRLGIGSTQSQLERIVALAPMYFRATGAILTDVFRGNIRGYMARRALIKGVAGMSALNVAITIGLSENKDNPEKLIQEIADHLNIRGSKGWTWEIAGQNIGPGTKMRSIAKLIADSASNPKRLTEMTLQNPALRFLLGSTSPVVGTGYDLISGTNPFTGERTRDNVLQFSKTVLAENLVPLTLQSAIWERGDSPPQGVALATAAQLGGWRSYPETPYQKLEKKRNQLAMEKYGMLWEELGASEDSIGRKTPGAFAQTELEQSNPDLRELTRVARERSSLMAQGSNAIWDKYNNESANIQKSFNSQLQVRSTEFKSTSDGAAYRENIDLLSKIRRHDFDVLKYRPEYTMIKDYFDEPLTAQQKREMNPQDLARREYYDMMFNPDLYDAWGNYNFDEADRREQLFVERFGQESLDYVQKFTESKIEDPVYLALKEDRKLLAQYWDLLPEIARKDELTRTRVESQKLTEARVKMRTQYPEIDAALNLWGYTTTTKTDKAMKLLEKKADALGVTKSKLPAIANDKAVQDIFSVGSGKSIFGGSNKPSIFK